MRDSLIPPRAIVAAGPANGRCGAVGLHRPASAWHDAPRDHRRLSPWPSRSSRCLESTDGRTTRRTGDAASGDMQKARIAAVTTNHRQMLRITNSHTYTLHDDLNNNGTIDDGETVTTVDLQLNWPVDHR